VQATGEHLIIEFNSEDENGDWDAGGEGWLSSIIPLRADLAAGDVRSLYLGWLLCAQLQELDGDDLEPPPPPDLKNLSGSLKSFADFLRFLRASIGSHAPLLRLPPRLALAMSWPVSVLLRDVLITREEMGALMADLLVSRTGPTTTTSLEAWLEADKPDLGGRYTSELRRHWSYR
jgi:hypothetical protein